MFSLSYRSDWRHFAAYSKLAYRGSPLLRFLHSLIVGLLAAAAITIVPQIDPQDIDGQSFPLGVIVMLVIWSLSAWAYQAALLRHLLKPDGNVLGDRRLLTSEAGIELISSRFNAKYDWNAFERVTLGKSILVLWFEPHLGLIVPRTAFATPSEESAFKALVEEKIRLGNSGSSPNST